MGKVFLTTMSLTPKRCLFPTCALILMRSSVLKDFFLIAASASSMV